MDVAVYLMIAFAAFGIAAVILDAYKPEIQEVTSTFRAWRGRFTATLRFYLQRLTPPF
ncbi:MAG: hypothetical protein FWH04_01280 [Oscillospiraceae bacterium]|nr:hypothetical protein [Oscillospiraceae bacterium]